MFGTRIEKCRLDRFQCLILQAAATLVLLPMLLLLPAKARAGQSWFVDAGRFHVSVHGQMSCRDCHGSVAGKTPHPNPADVNRSPADFFNIDQCTSCHEEVVSKIEDGTHGGKPIQDAAGYKVCVKCHDPHYQLAKDNLPAAFDPQKPVSAQCAACHAARTDLPAFSAHDARCMECHQAVPSGDPSAAKKISALCFQCHDDRKTDGGGPLPACPGVSAASYESTPHSRLTCTTCHLDSTEFGHGSQKRAACLQCHQRHDEKTAHDAHMNVTCEACHLTGVTPERNPSTGQVFHKIDRKSPESANLHQMRLKEGEDSCKRCHVGGNSVGASAMVLPPKSILCMPCHAATFSIGDTTTIIALAIFLLGIVILCIAWFPAGSAGERAGRTEGVSEHGENHGRQPVSPRILRVIQVLILDVLLQRRLFLQSRTRWLIHGLIFFPFVFRSVWGMIALLASLWAPASSLPWSMLDKNSPAGGLLFDISGLMILVGVVLAAARRLRASSRAIPGLPRPDWPALGIIGGIVIVGFILEGMRISMTGTPPGSGYSFVGYAVGSVFAGGAALTGIYGYVWYLHAVLTGAFVAYLPFSQLLHVIAAPIVMVLNAFSPAHDHREAVPPDRGQPAGVQH